MFSDSHVALAAQACAERAIGFRVDELVEPQPLPQVRERFPEDWKRLTTKPSFLLLRPIPMKF